VTLLRLLVRTLVVATDVYPSEMPLGAFKRYVAQAQSAAVAFAAPPAAGQPADWTVDIWNWGVPEEENQPLPQWEKVSHAKLYDSRIESVGMTRIRVECYSTRARFSGPR
jgi:hypothetical protein